MIESIEFSNFKALRKTTLPLAPFTLLLGPNGSGKTSVLQALQTIAAVSAKRTRQPGQATPPPEMSWEAMVHVSSREQKADVEIALRARRNDEPVSASFLWSQSGRVSIRNSKSEDIDENRSGFALADEDPKKDPIVALLQWLGRMQTYALDAHAIAQPVSIKSGSPLAPNGAGLAAVLDNLQNQPERWDSLLAEMREWLPEYDHILFDYPQQGQKRIVLRTKRGRHEIPANELSQGTLIALALLALAYLPDQPSLLGLEEIDSGLHPRLLRHLQDALYRLSYPESCGEARPPIQVIATTHSPYLLDLYREHPEEVVLAQKEGLEVQMRRLADDENIDEILGESPLSEVWYSGVLGGVTVKP